MGLRDDLRALRAATDTAWRDRYEDWMRRLAAGDAGAGAVTVGQAIPGFALPDTAGRYVSSDELLADGPLVLSFNRGGWCPYCRAELKALEGEAGTFAAAGGRVAAITGEVGGRTDAMRRSHGLSFPVLCDVDFGVTLAFGLLVPIGKAMLDAYRDRGRDFEELYGSPLGVLPIPATYVVDPGGIVRFAFVDPDFRNRAEPADILKALAEITG